MSINSMTCGIEIKDWSMTKMSFRKLSNPKEGTSIDVSLICQYRWKQYNGKTKIEGRAILDFVPKALFEGKFDFIINVSNTDDNIEKDDILEIVEAIAPPIGSAISLVSTVCGEAISQMKIIIPPMFTEIKEV